MSIDLKTWAETASEGDYLAYYYVMTVEETEPGHYRVTHDDSDGVIWEGDVEEPANDEQRTGGRHGAYARAYARAELAAIGSRCGWDDAELAEVRRILARGGLTLRADDRGLVAAAV
jgi:hypothetical protein